MNDVNTREFYGCAVDLSPNEAFAALWNPDTRLDCPEHRAQLEIHYRDAWYRLGLTDLEGTAVRSAYVSGGREAILTACRGAIRYGARIQDGVFLVVDHRVFQ